MGPLDDNDDEDVDVDVDAAILQRVTDSYFERWFTAGLRSSSSQCGVKLCGGIWLIIGVFD